VFDSARMSLSLPTASVAASWGQDRINQRSLPLDSNDDHGGFDGAGVNVYVIDTGMTN
jgi:hypothetical protein